jgi:hypothetical protein
LWYWRRWWFRNCNHRISDSIMARTLKRILRKRPQTYVQRVLQQIEGYAEGGITTYQKIDDNLYCIHSFIANSALYVKKTISAEIFMVGGGGGGGGRHGGGGGAGAVIYGFKYLEPGIYDVLIGEGGKGAVWDTWGDDGKSTTFIDTVAIGGGGGGTYNSAITDSRRKNGRPGGSGGGGGHSSGGYKKGKKIVYTVTWGTLYGNDGGYGSGDEGGGGGGATQNGLNGISGKWGGNGGDGILCPIDGYWYAGGGGGAGWEHQSGTGGRGGGGTGGRGYSTGFIKRQMEGESRNLDFHGLGFGGNYGNANGGMAAKNSGSGGGGSGQRDWNSVCSIGGDGGSGIVIVKYLIGKVQLS